MTKENMCNIYKLFQDIGTSFGNLFVGKVNYRKHEFSYNPLSHQECLNQDMEALKKDWETVGNTLGKYIKK